MIFEAESSEFFEGAFILCFVDFQHGESFWFGSTACTRVDGIAMQKLDFFIGKGQFGGGFWFFLVVRVNFFVEIVELYC